MSKRNYYLKKTCGIYCITHTESGKQYVGQSVDCFERWKQHSTSKKNSTGIKGAIMKYGVDAFSFQILEECKREELNEREIYWIEHLGTISPDGYNLNSGGGMPTTVSDETKKRMSEVQKGKTHSDESKQKMSKASKERTHSDETKKRMSEVQKGKTHSEETKRKIAKGLSGNKRKPISDETKRKISEASKGKTFSDDTKMKLSEASKEYWRKRRESAESCKDLD